MRLQAAEYTRLYWHGYPEDFKTWRRHSILRRFYLSQELDHLIEQSNDEGGGQPRDQR